MHLEYRSLSEANLCPLPSVSSSEALSPFDTMGMRVFSCIGFIALVRVSARDHSLLENDDHWVDITSRWDTTYELVNLSVPNAVVSFGDCHGCTMAPIEVKECTPVYNPHEIGRSHLQLHSDKNLQLCYL